MGGEVGGYQCLPPSVCVTLATSDIQELSSYSLLDGCL